MKRTIVSPWRFVVGPDILSEIGLHAKWLGKKALLLGGTRALNAVKEVIVASLRDNGLSVFMDDLMEVAERHPHPRHTAAENLAADSGDMPFWDRNEAR